MTDGHSNFSAALSVDTQRAERVCVCVCVCVCVWNVPVIKLAGQAADLTLNRTHGGTGSALDRRAL